MPNELDELKCFLLTIAKLETDEDFPLHHHHTREFAHHISGAMLPWIKTLEAWRRQHIST
jgi:mannose-6-phosphate isomerase-like protein (cupin superfamily)